MNDSHVVTSLAQNNPVVAVHLELLMDNTAQGRLTEIGAHEPEHTIS